jgi:hypothetical protein
LDPDGSGRLNGMIGHSPTPLVAAVGLVATAADGLRRLPRALGEAGHAAQRAYEDLARHGQDVLAGRAGPAADAPGPVEVPRTEAAAAGTAVPTARPAGPVGPRAGAVEPPATAPAAPVPPPGRSEPVLLPEDVQDEVAQLTPGADLPHADLPLPDFDHQTVPQLRGRLRTLGVAELVQLRDYEQAHAARLPVLTLLDNRIATLLADTGQ